MVKLGWSSLGESFSCPCGVTHALPIEVCRVSDNAAVELAEFSRYRCGRKCLVISDENTRQACGDCVCSALGAAGKQVSEHVFSGDSLEASAELGEEVAKLGAEAGFFVALGSGTLCDLAKYAGHVLNRPVLLFATAASMNGYTSSIAAIKVRGLKRTSPVAPAVGVFADPHVVATAPVRMSAAGVGDFLSKFSSSADWYTAHVLRGDYYCKRPSEFFEGTQEKVLAAAPGVSKGDPRAVAAVLEGLLLAGLSMVVAGSSAPASGGEHLISHYLDMKHAIWGMPNDLHGAQVGVATVYTLGLWERVLALDPSEIDVDACVARQLDGDEVRRTVVDDWGSVAQEILIQWRQKELHRAQVRDEVQKFIEELGRLRDALKHELLPPKVVAEAIRAAGGPVAPEELASPVAEFEMARRHARYLRNRFTILDLAAELVVE